MNTQTNIAQWINQSHLARILLLAILAFILLVPINSIKKMVFERKTTEAQAVAEVQQKWGQDQRIIGPLLVIPYQENHVLKHAHSDEKEIKTEIKKAVFLPEEFDVDSQLVNETRYRGLFEVPLYQATVTIRGHFAKPNFAAWNIKDDDVLWDKARLVVMVSDARAIQKRAVTSWNEQDYFFEPGTDEAILNNEGYHVDLTHYTREITKNEKHTFSLKLVLNGSESIYFAPLGKDSLVKINAPWPDPSFQGKWLPTKRKVSEDGFTSQWQIPYLGRNFAQQTKDFSSSLDNINHSLVGVDLISPIDNYRMSERSIKYVLLFLLLTFVAIWLIEVLAKLRVHLMQYLFIGAGLCLFYLLELSLSEHVGFYWAYAIATIAIVSMVALYSYVVLHTGKRAAIIGTILVALYVYLFTLLQEQNYSLLIGSIGLFAMLATVMYVTRKIDWFKLTQIE
jgi:inner membrane protein